MKRIVSLLTAVLMLLSLSACSHSAEALSEKYAAAKLLYEAGYSASVDFRMTVNGRAAEGEFEVLVAGEDASVIRKESNSARFYVKGCAYRKSYFVNGAYYEDTEQRPARVAERVDRAAFAAECASFFCINPYASAFPALTPEMLADAEVTAEGGREAFSVALSAEAVKAYLCDETLTSAEGILMAAFDEIGDLSALSLNLTVTGTDGATRGFEIVYNFYQRGGVPAVMAPEDAQTYIEL